ncbi:MAG TPA: SMI1/KNR4 family protein [Gemmata sp.]|nr:SMI1/KNR4 family protein [Gemmata sp.]
MIDWSTVFDEAYPVAGASAADVERFLDSVGQPLTSSEIEEINLGQQNPFPKIDPMHALWRPFDPSLWVIPNRTLPSSYLSLLSWSNGGEFRTGDRWFQFFPALDPGYGVRAMLLGYDIPQYLPGALPIASNGSGTFYFFDLRHPAVNGEYPVVCSQSGGFSWKPRACFYVADSFAKACRDRVSLEELRDRTA